MFPKQLHNTGAVYNNTSSNPLRFCTKQLHTGVVYVCKGCINSYSHMLLSGTLLVQAHHVYKTKTKEAQAKRVGQKSSRRGLKSRRRTKEQSRPFVRDMAIG